MLADEQHEVATMGEGNIAVAVGMKNVRTYYMQVSKKYSIFRLLQEILL